MYAEQRKRSPFWFCWIIYGGHLISWLWTLHKFKLFIYQNTWLLYKSNIVKSTGNKVGFQVLFKSGYLKVSFGIIKVKGKLIIKMPYSIIFLETLQDLLQMFWKKLEQNCFQAFKIFKIPNPSWREQFLMTKVNQLKQEKCCISIWHQESLPEKSEISCMKSSKLTKNLNSKRPKLMIGVNLTFQKILKSSFMVAKMLKTTKA